MCARHRHKHQAPTMRACTKQLISTQYSRKGKRPRPTGTYYIVWGGRSQAGYCGSNAHLLHLCLLTYVCNAYRVPCSHRNYVQYVGTLLRIVWCECELQSHITDRPLAHKTCLSHKAAVRGLGSSWLAGSLNPAQSQSPPARPVQTMLRCSLTWTGYISGPFVARGHAELKIIGSYWHNPYFY